MGVTLVTGASGFVGSHLVVEMTRRGLPVRGVSREMRSGLITIPSYSSDMNWRKYLAGIDVVVHLAARVHVMNETARDPLALFRDVNVAATVNLARQAAAAGVRRFVFVSSIKVNGERTEPGKAFTANDAPNPQEPYAISKAEAESALMALGRETGMEITVIRPPLVYGPGVRGNFRNLMKWAASGIPSIFPLVRNKRSFVHVLNLCDLLISVLDHPCAANRVFLVSDDEDLSTNELLRRLAITEGHRPRSIPIPLVLLRAVGALTRHQESMARLTENLQVDITETNRLLEWRPTILPRDTATIHSAPGT